MLEAALQTAAGAVIIIDDKGVIRTVNPATATIFGYSEGELVGHNVRKLMPEPFRSRHDGYIRHHLETGERRIIGIGRQVMALRKSGTIFPAHLAVSAFSHEGARFFTGIIHDLSERHETADLREQTLMQSIFNHLPDAVLIVDRAGTISLCNPAVARIFGYAPEELIGQMTTLLYQDAAETRRVRTIKEDLDGRGEPAQVSVTFRRKSGETFPAETAISVLRDERNDPAGYLLLSRDVSRLVAQEEALRKSQRLEAIGQLTGGIAHDFNNLLTIITGNHELLEMELEDSGQRDLLSRANNAALMGARLTNRLLTFARRRKLEPAELDLNEQILAMAELLRRTLGESVVLGTLLAPGLWRVRADPGEIENAVLNLAINARDAMPAGGKLIIETSNVVLDAMDVAAEVGLAAGEYVRLAVSDTGAGMSHEVLARAFEPFFTTKEPGKGTGLGLSVIYGFVRQSGGHVTASSALGKGTTVTLYLPRVDAGAVETIAPARPASSAPMARETILLVEDNAEVRAVTARRLRHLGYRVIEAESGARAIEILNARRKIDLVFSDVVMPGMSGFELAHWLANHQPSVPVLLASGFAEDVARAGEPPASALEILRKPYSGAELAQALRRAIDNR
ncbi:MAG: PAS domain S-box protein [Hyphomicrobiaceae bacterium]